MDDFKDNLARRISETGYKILFNNEEFFKLIDECEKTHSIKELGMYIVLDDLKCSFINLKNNNKKETIQ